MSKKLLLFFAIAFVSLPTAAVAQTATVTVAPTTTVKTQAQSLKDQKLSAKQTLLTSVDEFKQKIQAIKDEKKKLIVQRIDDRVATSNARLTNKMTAALTRLTALVNILKERSSALKTGGKDTGALDAAIAAAETAISNAQTQVNAQAQKTYSANITTDATLKNTIGVMVSTFRTDISAVHKAVMDAKQAVMKAFSELAKLSGLGDTNASASGKTINQ